MSKRSNLLRLIGLVLLGVLLWRLDTRQTLTVMGQAVVPLVLAAVVLNIPGILIKSLRWRWLLQSQGIRYGTVPSALAYFGSIFIGMLTPGRLGEFVKAVHVSRDCGVSSGRGFSSVLADRLFDLYALAVVGGLAMITLGSLGTALVVASLGILVLALVLPIVLLLNGRTFVWMQRFGMRLGKPGRALFKPEGWLAELRGGLGQLSLPWVVLAVALTVCAYAVFYSQAYLLAWALHLDATVLDISYAVALGSLVTLIPISISGLGTREAAIVAYLGTTGATSEAALSFSLLVFLTFYIGTGLIGSVAWLVKPVKWERGGRMGLSELRKVRPVRLTEE